LEAVELLKNGTDVLTDPRAGDYPGQRVLNSLEFVDVGQGNKVSPNN